MVTAGSSVFTIVLSFLNQHILRTYGVRDTDRDKYRDKGTKRDKDRDTERNIEYKKQRQIKTEMYRGREEYSKRCVEAARNRSRKRERECLRKRWKEGKRQGGLGEWTY